MEDSKPTNPGAKTRTAQAHQAMTKAKTATPPAQAVATAQRLVRQMDASRFNGLEFSRNAWLATAHENTTPEDLLEPAYWAHVAYQLTPRCRIEAWANDGTWMAEYVVLEAGRNWARPHLLNVHHFTTDDQARTLAEQMSPYEVTFRGPHSKWSVIRKSDRQVVSEGHETVRAAADWLDGRMKAEK